MKAADLTQVVGGVLGAGGVIGAAGEVVKQVEEAGGLVSRFAAAVEPIISVVTDNLWLLLVAGGVAVVWQTGVLKKIRLWKHQTGNDVSL